MININVVALHIFKGRPVNCKVRQLFFTVDAFLETTDVKAFLFEYRRRGVGKGKIYWN